MILKEDDEAMIDAIERKAREMSVSPLYVAELGASVADLYELVGALASEVKTLRAAREKGET